MNNNPTVLVVEDEHNISSFIGTILAANNYRVLKASCGAESLSMITSHCPDIIILDLGLPDMDGQNIIRSVREWTQLPIIVVSARSHERDKVASLDLGADDYLTKPFGTSELLARIRTALRHSHLHSIDSGIEQCGIFRAGGLVLDYDKRRITLDGADIRLTQNEYKIVSLLAKYSGKVLTYDYIIKHIWGPNANCDNQILRVNMANIRRKLERNPAEPQYIFTEMGVGYRMIEND